MTDHQLDWNLHNLSPDEPRYVIALLRYHAGLRAEFASSSSYGRRARRRQTSGAADALETCPELSQSGVII